MTTLEVLKAAREKIAKGWTRGIALLSIPDPSRSGSNEHYTAFRWALVVSKRHVGIMSQEHSRESGEWSHGRPVIAAYLCEHWRTPFRVHHMFYDGPNCFVDLGWVQIAWTGTPISNHCDKCWGDDPIAAEESAVRK